MNVVELRELEEELNGVLATYDIPALQEWQLEVLIQILCHAPRAWEGE